MVTRDVVRSKMAHTWRALWVAAGVGAAGAACGGRSHETAGESTRSSYGGSAGTGATSNDGGASTAAGGAPGSGGASPGGAGSGATGGSASGSAGLGGSEAVGGAAGSAGEGEAGAAQGGEGGSAGAGGAPDVPGFDDLVVRSSRMSDYEGLTVIGTFDHNFGENSRSAPRVVTVAGGAFSLVWAQGFNRDSFGTYIVLFVDRDGNGWCTEGSDPAWSTFVSNDLRADEPVIHDFDPDSSRPNTDSITCDEFDHWFGEDFPGL